MNIKNLQTSIFNKNLYGRPFDKVAALLLNTAPDRKCLYSFSIDLVTLFRAKHKEKW